MHAGFDLAGAWGHVLAGGWKTQFHVLAHVNCIGKMDRLDDLLWEPSESEAEW